MTSDSGAEYMSPIAGRWKSEKSCVLKEKGEKKSFAASTLRDVILSFSSGESTPEVCWTPSQCKRDVDIQR